MKRVRMKKKKTGVFAWMRSRPFMLLAFGLAAMAMVLIVRLPKMTSGVDRQNEQLLEIMDQYSQTQAEYNVAQSELARCNDPEYIETIARRVHGFGWYGETIYEIANIEELEAAQTATGMTGD